VGPRTGLDTEATGKKTLLPLPGMEPRSPCRRVRSQTLTELLGSTCEYTLRVKPATEQWLARARLFDKGLSLLQLQGTGYVFIAAGRLQLTVN
jgi:hypothetical protein